MIHPLLLELNTRCWLSELSVSTGRAVTLDSVPVTYYGAIDGRMWRFGAVLDLEGMIALAKSTAANF